MRFGAAWNKRLGCCNGSAAAWQMDVERERGAAVILMAVFVFPILLILLVGVLEFGCAYNTWAAQRDDLSLSVEVAEQPWFDLELKNSETPGSDLSVQLARGLRENGFDGEIDVWLAERDLSSDAELCRYRAIAFYVVVKGSYEPLSAAGFFGEGIELSNSECDYILAYSSNTAWKPSNAEACSGKWHLPPDAPTTDMTRSGDEYTDEDVWKNVVEPALNERLDAAVEKATQEAGEEAEAIGSGL